jgi:hypothetical protein
LKEDAASASVLQVEAPRAVVAKPSPKLAVAMTAPRRHLLLALHLLLRTCASAGDGVKSSTAEDRLIHAGELNTVHNKMHPERDSPEVVPPHQEPAHPDEAAPQATSAVACDACDAAGVPRASAKVLAVFTLVRGGSSEADYESFVSSRRCLDDVMPAWFPNDHVAFHEGNVPNSLQLVLRQRV